MNGSDRMLDEAVSNYWRNRALRRGISLVSQRLYVADLRENGGPNVRTPATAPTAPGHGPDLVGGRSNA